MDKVGLEMRIFTIPHFVSPYNNPDPIKVFSENVKDFSKYGIFHKEIL